MKKPKLAVKAALLGILALGAMHAARSGQLTIATDPLGTGTSSIKANVMFILDDSGSMGSDYMPDQVQDSGAQAGCFDNGDDGDGSGTGTIDGTPNACVLGDPPYMSSDFNTIYYNPRIRYRPGVNADGTEMPAQTSANTTGWTAVRTNPYQSATTANLLSGFPDRVWCASTADDPAGGNCRQNAAYQYPDSSFSRTSSLGTYITGSPYSYRMKTAQWCSDAARTNCVSGNNVDPLIHIYQSVELCTDSELTDCTANTAAQTAAHLFSGVRWCNNANLLDDGPAGPNSCQRKKISPFLYAKHLGRTKIGSVPQRVAEGTIQVNAVYAGGGTINSITIGGVSVIPGPITIPAGSTTAGVAALITGSVAHANFTDSASGNKVTIQTVAADGSAFNGQAILVSASSVGTTAARGRVTITDARRDEVITSFTVGPDGNPSTDQQLLSCAPASSPVSFTVSGNRVDWITGGGTNGALSHLKVISGSNSTNRRVAMRDALVYAIDTCATTPAGGTAPWDATADSSDSNTRMLLTAPLNLGAGANNWIITVSGSTDISKCNVGQPSSCGGSQTGVSTAAATVATQPMSGGAAAFSGIVRVGVGQVTRTDIVASSDVYPKAVGRSDCAGATCTYDEEMANFANWYAYHRTRMLMMKSAAGRAFSGINESYRVGLITICPVSGTNCSDTTSGSSGFNIDPGKYLRIADFDAIQKAAWYAKLYSQSPSNFTPLREALSRVGLIFAGKVSGADVTPLTGGLAAADDPVIASCQPNFAILSTDGYWNGGPGRQLDGTTLIGNQDSVNQAPYSLENQGVFDGGTPTAENTLADVALYYYGGPTGAIDLRSTLADTVPTTTKDTNNRQHMVTFTLGLGLDGQLTYRADYETATTGDFAAIRAGSKRWPAPSAGSLTTLDDLWHAAVNGRGIFFSAKNPDDLASSLSETLNQLQARIGAGAAAATSNLQPVAGDNFAYTAQYQTADWIGDLRARTIDLGTGTVSGVTLWSAAEILDATSHTSRQILMYDATDVAGNKLKHFCMPADLTATWCNDGLGLTAAEQAWFDPAIIALTQESSWTAAGTTQSLVNYLRGDTSNYNSGSSPRAASDLYRARASQLGDIVNAQPAYVKKSPFSYGDTGYAGFKACTEGFGTACAAAQFPSPALPRRGTVYAASNDGLLHAFETDVNNSPYYQTAGISTLVTSDDTFSCNPLTCNVGNGVERWAYVPSMAMPAMHLLANEPYTHRYYTDGTPQAGDICVSTPCAGQNDWRTILVAGLNSGGRGYYALDVTNPLPGAIKALWEFTYTSSCVTVGALGVPVGGPYYGDCHVGLTFGNPIITKRSSDGKWVVIVASGYNNGSVDGNGDGKGYLYVLDAVTGAILHRLTTGNGTAASPSGLAKINGWTTNGAADNTTLAIYGGDLDGNLWRFDLNYQTGLNPNYMTVTKVAQVKDASGIPQPITVKPELGEYATKRIILFGTGKLLETSDKASTGVQTIYALRDEPSVAVSPVISDVRVDTVVRPRVLVDGKVADTRTVQAGTAPNWATEYGWRIDLPETGERVNVDPQLQLGTLVVASNVPTADTCTAGGFSFINFLDYATGSYIPGTTSGIASVRIGSSLTVGLNVIMLPGGKVQTIITTADNQQLTKDTPVSGTGFSGRRVSWRELIKEQ